MNVRQILVSVVAWIASVGAFSMTTITVKRAGTLASVLSRKQQDTCTSLGIRGKLNSADLKVLRRMAGYDEGQGTGRLAYLDLSEARIVTSNEVYMALDAAEEWVVCAAYAKEVEEVAFGDNNRRVDKVQKYGVAYVLAYRSDEKFSVLHKSAVRFRNNGIRHNYPGVINESFPRLLVSKDEFVFRKGLTDDEWGKLKRAGITKFAGHRLVREGERYVMYCFTQKGVFSGDFFYKCPCMRVVVLPNRKRLDESVTVYESPVCYMHKRVVVP